MQRGLIERATKLLDNAGILAESKTQFPALWEKAASAQKRVHAHGE